jgi:hypothetical protein
MEDVYINVAVIKNTITAQMVTSIFLIHYHEVRNDGDKNTKTSIF